MSTTKINAATEAIGQSISVRESLEASAKDQKTNQDSVEIPQQRHQ